MLFRSPPTPRLSLSTRGVDEGESGEHGGDRPSRRPWAWLRWGAPARAASQAYYAFDYELTGPADDSGPSGTRTGVHLSGLGLQFSVPSDLAVGGLDAAQADQVCLARSPLVVDPPWPGSAGKNVEGESLPWEAAVALAKGEWPEGYTVHHLARLSRPPGSSLRT